MIFKLYSFARSGNVGSKLLFILAIFAIAYLINWPTVPKAAKATPFPFPKDSCLVYSAERFRPEANTEQFQQEVCFSSTPANGFIEKSGNMQTTFGKDGYADLTDEDIAIWKKNLGGKSDPLFDFTASRLDFHNRYFAQPKLEPGVIFYDRYPVTKLAEFNGKKTYMVETAPWIDTRLTHRGVISKLWWKLQYKYDRQVFTPTERKSGSRDTVERHYYDYATGILEGEERLIVERAQDGTVLSSTVEERRVLQEVKS